MSKDNATPNWRSRLQGWAENTLQDIRSSPTADRVTQFGKQASAQVSGAWKLTSDQARASAAWQALESGAEQVRNQSQEVARETGERLVKAKNNIERLVGAIDELGRHADDRDKALELATQIFEQAGPYLDLIADGVAVGTIQGAGAGVANLQGTEVYFVPPDGPVRAQLRIHRMVGKSARLAVGGHVGAYVASLYGPRDLLTRNLERRGADLGLIALSLGFFRATSAETNRHHVGGWLMELAAGIAIGIPVLSDLSAFELKEMSLATYSLAPGESAPIEEALSQAPDRSMRRAVARRLAGDPEGKAG